MPHPLILQWRTARYLKISQVFFYALRRFFPFRRTGGAAAPPVRKLTRAVLPCSITGIYVDDWTFRFLNVEVKLSDGQTGFDWAAVSEQRLWRYNLHYFDYLRESARPAENKDRLIQSWIEENPQGSQPGWEPYTTSLRIVNWILYLQPRPSGAIPAAWLDSLYLQVRWLERNDERHILATHYFENLKALLFAGCFFAGNEATRWRNRAQKEIRLQLSEQTLRDGGHYERSHQYHCIMVENYLDIANLSQACPDPCPRDFIAEVRATAELGLQYLSVTLFPDGTIPLFNDSAFGISIPPMDLFAYAERLRVNVKRTTSEPLELIDCPDSGLYGCRAGGDIFIIDCGDIGPAYQPGHTHCDFLSFELMLAKRRVVVDTGVCEYEPGAMRNYVRSTRAHNTVAVDGGEQSEIWGEFRVARRARKIAASIGMHGDTVEFSGAFQGFFDVRNRIRHERTVIVELAGESETFQKLTVTDRLYGSGNHIAESFVHFHPDLSLERSQSGEINLLDSGSSIATIRMSKNQEWRFEPGLYCPEFGMRIPNQVLVLRTQGDFPITMQYEIAINRL